MDGHSDYQKSTGKKQKKQGLRARTVRVKAEQSNSALTTFPFEQQRGRDFFHVTHQFDCGMNAVSAHHGAPMETVGATNRQFLNKSGSHA